ncbi:ribonuclease Y [Blattabacterium cuenoti]|uniref:ribonuclease Y n=1 Tax=Blattabacterium cuenoti TaxID=1653831 RepID=UPI00163C7C93|nr:ribonuclease Y [Blattabacterium cuenoti]
MEKNVGISFLMGWLIGIIICYLFVKKIILKTHIHQLKKSKIQLRKIIRNAEKEREFLKRKQMIQVKRKFIELRIQHEKHARFREKKTIKIENQTIEKDEHLSKEIEIYLEKNDRLKLQIQDYESKYNILKNKRIEFKNIHIRQVALLEKISNLSTCHARDKLIEILQRNIKEQAKLYIREILDKSRKNAEKEAKKILIQSIQRIGKEQSIENSVSIFNINSNEVKGRIIGKEGRNIRALEKATGVEIIVDDTPQTILLSCFNPIRREVARVSLTKLVIDGRIHPAKIEEIVRTTEKNLEKDILEIGKKNLIELGIYDMHPKLISMIGKMKYRFSYGQNLLQHSREVAHLSSMLSSELGLNAKIAKRAGLLHDIGKIPETELESEFPHAILGMKWAKKYGETIEVYNAIGGHHDEIEMTGLIGPVIQISDAISGSRPGIRKNSFESYSRRLKELESIAFSFNGVKKAFAIQAGRELRVLVESNKINDKQSLQLSYDIMKKIKNTIIYPGQIKVTVIREIRSIQVIR